MLKNLLILGVVAAGGYYGYKWLTKPKTTASASPVEVAVKSGGWFTQEQMDKFDPDLRGAPVRIL